MTKKDDEKGHFKLIQKTPFHEIDEEQQTVLKESDLCFQDDNCIYQFEYVDSDKEYLHKIDPGMFSLISRSSGQVEPKKTEFRKNNLLTSIVNTRAITAEADAFFDNLDIYEELGEPKARKILLFSDPGMGKTAAITQYCVQACEQDPGTVVLVWPTAEIEAHQVSSFLSKFSEYTEECTRLILVMEDIGGGERDGYSGNRSVDSAMLDLLDGIQVTFKLPTLILSTTNYPQNLLSALADRPQRFDLLLQLEPPSYEEQVDLIEFIGKQAIDDDTKTALQEFGKDFSIAHLKEVVIRSKLHKKGLGDTIKEIQKHRDRFKNNFEEEKESMGFGLGRD
jgi:hypothetical protein